MSVLFIAPSQFSIGELHNAVTLAKQLEEGGINTFFLTSQNHIDYTINAKIKAKALPRKTLQFHIVQEIAESIEAKAIIIADYHNLDIESPLIDLDKILELNIPVATIDSLSFGPNEKILKNQLFAHSFKKKAAQKQQNIVRRVPSQMKIIRTCPVNNPNLKDERIFPVSLYPQGLKIKKQFREKIRSKYQCLNNEDKLIMLSKSAWANLLVKMKLMETRSHMKSTYNYEFFIQELLTEYLSVKAIKSKIVIVGVSPDNNFIPINLNEKVTFIPLPFLDLEDYDELLLSCDLFVTDNITSASMAKSLIGSVPVLSLINTKVFLDEQKRPVLPPAWKRPNLLKIMDKWLKVLPDGIYPFITFPNGWINELKDLFDKNPILEVLETVEIFDIKETGFKIHNLLYCEETKHVFAEKQKVYVDLIKNTPSAKDMLHFIQK
ncbi:DUF6365 family protein [Bacillus sp. Bos-x628]|uniref:DUF6365 family protein n=1 Tax=Bacillus maqinnsis TaxID=3229854 RepID=UPI00338EB09B